MYGGTPGYGAYPPARPQSSSNTLSTLGIVFGAISFLFFPILFGPIGIVLGAVAKSRGESKATTALWVSILGLVIGMIIGALVWSSA
jgi:membrane protein DedA with SNARE-associated domain